MVGAQRTGALTPGSAERSPPSVQSTTHGRAPVAPTLENVLILALIVVIRTFLSMALQLEVEGRWPWQRGEESGAGTR